MRLKIKTRLTIQTRKRKKMNRRWKSKTKIENEFFAKYDFVVNCDVTIRFFDKTTNLKLNFWTFNSSRILESNSRISKHKSEIIQFEKFRCKKNTNTFRIFCHQIVQNDNTIVVKCLENCFEKLQINFFHSIFALYEMKKWHKLTFNASFHQ